MENSAMHVTLVHVHVKPERIDAFLRATTSNHENSVREPGNLRFDVLQDPTDEAHFVLYEAYQDEASALAHKQTEHYLLWRETVAEMMAEPREGLPMRGLLP
jgi:(4S)-4-hydroxy-5-phosphonooxypentane-2,3-dione isomerase